MNETNSKKKKIELVDDTQREKIVTNSITKTRSTTKSDEREKIVQESQEEKQQSEEDEKRNRCLSLRGEKIGREELIEGERERFGIELTSITRMTLRTKTNEFFDETRIAL